MQLKTQGAPQRLKCYDALISLSSVNGTAGLFYSESAPQSRVDDVLTCQEFGGNKMYSVGDSCDPIRRICVKLKEHFIDFHIQFTTHCDL